MTLGRINKLETFGSVDGPGVRFVVFTQGCPMRCLFCHNPETWDFKGESEGAFDITAEDLLKKAGLPYYNILQVAHRKSKWGVILDMLIRDWKILVFSLRHKIDLLTGTSPEVAHIGWLLRKKAIVTTEDDDCAVPNFGKVIASFVRCVLTPAVCNMGNLEPVCSHYPHCTILCQEFS